ncbi:carboxyl transferase domain-containing protein [Kitasatospora viridis]|uniref:Acetyl-coenzyme A carboxylase carboxyl transferase subunits beta/alpha n=1 Tax=Kitasatospora viridis TaxID=281105 RepID=A0A561UBN3_9ACTN|nr:carboxyl transferase domain-containing protein [Kitasatospora viridis]TWF96768.1 acetyl-CoA carboxylase carboxyl transferase subunit beta [Kitasatospora viridis]
MTDDRPPPRPAALTFAERLLDPGSFRSWDTPVTDPDPGPDYAADLARARARSGADEAALTGEGRIGGHRVALLLSEFGFLGGSIGTATAARLLHAVERATAERLPLLGFPASGGTRMQEGTPAFVRMIAIANAVTAHKAAGLPYLVHLRHPTTGGVLASWGSLGQLTTAEPGALVGFLGPRVHQALYGEPFPEGVQRAEHLARFGTVDAVLPDAELRERLVAVLEVLAASEVLTARGTSGPPTSDAPSGADVGGVDVWESVRITRRPDRPGLAELLALADRVVPLSGTGAGERDDAMRLALARIAGASCVVVGHDRAAAALHGPVGPGGLRTARRGMRLAAELRLPLLTVIDTHGAELSPAAEEGALAGEIARCVAELSALPVPVVSLLLGEGAGGAALALLPADRALAAQHAWLSPLPPEGASVILHRTPDHAPRLAAQQRIGARELLREGVVDRLVPESPDLLAQLLPALAAELAHAARLVVPAARIDRFRSLGSRLGG